MRAKYDEDLESNPFFASFKIQQPMLFESSIKKKWIILVPYSGSFTKEKYDDFDFLNHVLVPVINENGSINDSMYKTLGNQKIKIFDSSIIIYSKESSFSKKVQILFDETFYNENDIAYKVLCISEPLNSEVSKSEQKIENGKVFALNSVEDSKLFLWKFMAKRSTKLKVDELISATKSEIQKLDSPSIQDCLLLMKNLYVNAFQDITSHRTYMKLVSKNENLKSSLKLALEMYICNSVHSVLFPALTDATAEKDEEINKATRAFQDIRASKSGIRFDMCENIPKAKKELNSIRKISTPLEICECIRRVIAELSSFRKPIISLTVMPNDESSNSLNNLNDKKLSHSTSKSGLMVNSDDLLSALIFLVIKSEIPNWYSYLSYGDNFRFAPCSRDDEYQYYLTTLEATLEHIRSMGNNTVDEDLVMDVSFTLSKSSADSSMSPWTDIVENSVSSSRIGVVAYELNQVRQLFKLIESGQVSAVKELIQRSYRVDYPIFNGRRTLGPANFSNNQNDHYCHPLCNCKAVMVDRKSCQSLVERSMISVDFQSIPASRTFDTAESTPKKYFLDSQSICSTSSQPPTFSLSSVDDKGWNSIHKAAYCGQLDILSLLVEFQYLLDSITLEGDTPMHLAARKGHQNIIFKLLDSGADVSITNYAGQTPMHIAVEYGYASCVSTLIYYGSLQATSNLNCVNNSGNTPLHIAAMWGYESIIKCLLDHSASTIIKNNKGLRPADVASTRKLSRLINIKAQQQELELISTETTSTISKLLQTNQIESSNSLMKTKQKTSLVKKTKRLTDQFPKDLIRNNNPVNVTDSLTRKIERLLKVVADGDIQMMKFLLEITEETEIDEPIDINQELCHPLCQCTKCHPVQKLIIKSSNQQLHINSTNKEGFHCLHIAAIHDRSTIAKFLLRYGADPNIKTHKLELTPLHLAAIYGSIKVLNLLLHHKSTNPNALDKKLNTPLLYSCTKCNIDIVESLLKIGVTINTSNHRGNTPLHEAVRNNRADIVTTLLEHGADINSLNLKGLSPFDLSKDLNIYFILQSARKKRDLHKNIEVDMSESGMVSLNSSIHTDQNMFNVDTDGLSLCSGDISLPSSDDNDIHDSQVERLFPDDDPKSYLTSPLLLDKCDSPFNEVDSSLLERLDKNSKYNYRLIFKDPNSPSISSTNSSK